MFIRYQNHILDLVDTEPEISLTSLQILLQTLYSEVNFTIMKTQHR